jgi:hypothetical protein
MDRLANLMFHRRSHRGVAENIKLLESMLKSSAGEPSAIMILSCLWLEKVAELRQNSPKGERHEWQSAWLDQVKQKRKWCRGAGQAAGMGEAELDLALEALSFQVLFHPNTKANVLSSGKIELHRRFSPYQFSIEDHPWLGLEGDVPMMVLIPFSFFPRDEDLLFDKFGLDFSQKLYMDLGAWHWWKASGVEALVLPSRKSTHKMVSLFQGRENRCSWNGVDMGSWCLGSSFDSRFSLKPRIKLSAIPTGSHDPAELLEQLKHGTEVSHVVSVLENIWKLRDSDKTQADFETLMILGLSKISDVQQLQYWAKWSYDILKGSFAQGHGQALSSLRSWMLEAKVPRALQQQVFIGFENIITGRPLQLGPFDLSDGFEALQPLPEIMGGVEMLKQVWELDDIGHSFSRPQGEIVDRYGKLKLHRSDHVEKGLIYFAFKVRADGRKKARLYLSRYEKYSTQKVWVWHNGKSLLEDGQQFEYGVDAVKVLPISFQKGVHLLLFKVQYDQFLSLRAQLGDVFGASIDGLECDVMK